MGVTLTNTIGRRSSESTAGTNPTGSAFSYDPMGRVNINSQCTPQNCSGTPFSIVYTYDFLGDVHTSTNGAAVTLTNSYNAGARLTSFTSSLSDSNHPGTPFGYQNVAHYNAAGSILSVTLGNLISETRTYDGRLRLTGITDPSVYTLTIPSGYAPNNDILAANDTVNGNWNYAYDGFNRLCASNQGGQTSLLCTSTNNTGQKAFTYAYDRFGNRWNQTVTAGSGPAPSYGFDANNHITGATGVTYDAAGDTTGDGTHTYTYDAEGRVSQVDGGTTASYLYDAEGRRVRKTTSSGNVDFTYDLAGHEIAQFTSTGTWTRGEVYAGGRHVATYQSTSPMTWFNYSDWLGTERVRQPYPSGTNETCTSLPFGDALSCTGTDVSPMHFTGKEHDTETNLENFGARYDASSMGRFMTPDWSASPNPVPFADISDPQSINLYVYVRDNPLGQTDPSGHCSIGGETHGFWWCLGHALGLTETQQEYQQRIANERQWLVNNVARNAADVNALKAASASGIDGVYRKWDEALHNAQCPWYAPCEEQAPDAMHLQRASDGSFVPLSRLHSDSTITEGNSASYNYWKNKSTEEIIDSLKSAADQPLTVRANGTILDGNTRIKVLEERGIDINKLERTIIDFPKE